VHHVNVGGTDVDDDPIPSDIYLTLVIVSVSLVRQWANVMISNNNNFGEKNGDLIQIQHFVHRICKDNNAVIENRQICFAEKWSKLSKITFIKFEVLGQ
jgi:hypothetical protein